MLFVPETGVGLPDATSYIDQTTFESISDLLGYNYAELTAETIEQRLVRATLFIDAEYRRRFPGTRRLTTQALEWPREKAEYVDGAEIAIDAVPKEVQIATVELVYLLEQGIALQPVLSASGELTYNRQRVEGAVEQEQRFSSNNANRRDISTLVEDALSRITGGMGSYYELRIQRVGGNG